MPTLLSGPAVSFCTHITRVGQSYEKREAFQVSSSTSLLPLLPVWFAKRDLLHLKRESGLTELCCCYVLSLFPYILISA